ncbi:hypothetical protein ACFQ2M_22490 [Kitasatospora saccharophila]|uniref:hypothetical protein n=1 Tax=Kitasatospora saccharophila TaxID=407973 RepID=UPI00363624AE
MTDKQNSNGIAAQFFLATYLGCRPRQDPAEVTHAFYDKSVKWVNAQEIPPETKSVYLVSLHAELLSQSSDVNPREFARKHLDEEHRDGFLNSVCGDDIPKSGFPKDVDRIASRLSTIQIAFGGGTSVIAPQSAFDDGTVTMEQADNGKSRLVVTDDVTELKGKAKSGARPKKDKPEGVAETETSSSQSHEDDQE